MTTKAITFGKRPLGSGRSGMRKGGIAAALAILASGAGAPGISGAAWAKAEASFGLEFAPYAALPAARAPVAGAVDIATIDPADPVEAEDRAGEPIGAGMASWYGREFAGRRTASGERFDPSGYTAAHRSLPFGSKVRVTNERTGDSVVVRINDRGPFTRSRVIDVSQAAARELGLIGPGHGRVSLSLIGD